MPGILIANVTAAHNHTRRSKMMTKTLLAAAMVAAIGLTGCANMGGGAGGDSTKRTAGEVVDDAAILAKVKAAYAADPDISALKINVDSTQGAVRLKGEVKNITLWRKAEDIAKKTSGVKSVENNLVITG
jgi:hyperosmotically inducible protein